MKKMIIVIVAVLLAVLTSCRESRPVIHDNCGREDVFGEGIIKRVYQKAGSQEFGTLILLENGVFLKIYTDSHSLYVNATDGDGKLNPEYNFLFAEPGDTVYYENGKIVEIRFND